MSTAALFGLLLAIAVVAAAAFLVRRSYERGMDRSDPGAHGRIVDNRGRPAQPEPGETNPRDARRP